TTGTKTIIRRPRRTKAIIRRPGRTTGTETIVRRLVHVGFAPGTRYLGAPEATSLAGERIIEIVPATQVAETLAVVGAQMTETLAVVFNRTPTPVATHRRLGRPIHRRWSERLTT